MKNIYVVTHTESLHHIQGRVGGWYDTVLTKNGQLQALEVANRLVKLLETDVPVITSSDLLRARETAEIIAKKIGRPVQLTADLRELGYGSAEGQPQSWLEERFEPAPYENRLDHQSVEGAETKREFLTRIYRAANEIFSSKQNEHVVVTHGYAMTFIVASWIGMPLELAGFVNFRSTPGGITHLQEDNFLRNRAVRFLNDTSHLKLMGT